MKVFVFVQYVGDVCNTVMHKCVFEQDVGNMYKHVFMQDVCNMYKHVFMQDVCNMYKHVFELDVCSMYTRMFMQDVRDVCTSALSCSGPGLPPVAPTQPAHFEVSGYFGD